MGSLNAATATLEPTARNDAPSVFLIPWRENPYRLVNWWEVHNFLGAHLHEAIMVLERIRCEWQHARPAGDSTAARMLGQRAIVSPAQREALALELADVAVMLKHCGLLVSEAALSEMRDDLVRHQIPGYDRLSAEQFVGRIDEVQRTVRREMQTTLFLYVQNDNASLYSNPIQNWESVVSRWPRIQTDVVECSKCFSLDRYAAAVFHALLVAEFGVIQVTDLVQVSGDKPGWGGVQRLEKILQRPYKDRSTPEQTHSDLLSEIVPMIVSIRDSMRHKISHVDNKLDWLSPDIGPIIADEVITATRAFMRRLAEELPV